VKEASISFRPLDRADLPLLQKWLFTPHVAAWWNEPLDLPGLERKYGPRLDGTEPCHVFIIEREATPIGWIQWYLWSDYAKHAAKLGAGSDSAGVDLAIGEPSHIGLGLGPAALRKFIEEVVFSNSEVRSVLCDPEEKNLRSVRAFEKAGFKVIRTVQHRGEECRRHVVRFDRRS
jgi:aminoglycoside 6'-N-acetyltransferase